MSSWYDGVQGGFISSTVFPLHHLDIVEPPCKGHYPFSLPSSPLLPGHPYKPRRAMWWDQLHTGRSQNALMLYKPRSIHCYWTKVRENLSDFVCKVLCNCTHRDFKWSAFSSHGRNCRKSLNSWESSSGCDCANAMWAGRTNSASWLERWSKLFRWLQPHVSSNLLWDFID